jgi:hypothetical protein
MEPIIRIKQPNVCISDLKNVSVVAQDSSLKIWWQVAGLQSTPDVIIQLNVTDKSNGTVTTFHLNSTDSPYTYETNTFGTFLPFHFTFYNTPFLLTD